MEQVAGEVVVTGARLPHEVCRHVHIAAEAVRVAQQWHAAPFHQLRRRSVEPASRTCVGQVAEQKGEAHLPEAHEARHAVGGGTPVLPRDEIVSSRLERTR